MKYFFYVMELYLFEIRQIQILNQLSFWQNQPN
jgi:hypothetical protein